MHKPLTKQWLLISWWHSNTKSSFNWLFGGFSKVTFTWRSRMADILFLFVKVINRWSQCYHTRYLICHLFSFWLWRNILIELEDPRYGSYIFKLTPKFFPYYPGFIPVFHRTRKPRNLVKYWWENWVAGCNHSFKKNCSAYTVSKDVESNQS